MNFKVEGLLYLTRTQADIVAQRFARRYGRDILVSDGKGKPLYLVAQNGKKRTLDGKPRK